MKVLISAASKNFGTTMTNVAVAKKTNGNVLILSASKIQVFVMANHSAWINLMSPMIDAASRDSTTTLLKSVDVILTQNSPAKMVINVFLTLNSVTVSLSVMITLMKVKINAVSKDSICTTQRTADVVRPNLPVNQVINVSPYLSNAMALSTVPMDLMKVPPITVTVVSKTSSSTTQRSVAATQLHNGPVLMEDVLLNLNTVTANLSAMITLMKIERSAAGMVTNSIIIRNVAATQILIGLARTVAASKKVLSVMVMLNAEISPMKVTINAASKVSHGTTRRHVAVTQRVSGHALMATVSLTLSTAMVNHNAEISLMKAITNVVSESTLSTTPKSVAATPKLNGNAPMANAS
jgi:hypothetical protein